MSREPQNVAIDATDDVLQSPQSLAAFSATVSSTGWISVGEQAMTPQYLARRSLLLQRLGKVAVAIAAVR